MAKNRDPRQKLAPARKRQAAALDAVLHPKAPKFIGPHESEQDAANAAAAEHFGLPYVKCKPGQPVVYAEPAADLHEELALAVSELIAVLNAIGRGDERARGKVAKVQADAKLHEAVKAAIRRIGHSDLLDRPYRERAIKRVFATFAEFKRIEGLPTAQAFVRRLRRRNPR